MSKLRIFLDSGANAFSCREVTVGFDELGVTEAEWDAMMVKDKDALAREIAFEQSEWGYHKVESDDE